MSQVMPTNNQLSKEDWGIAKLLGLGVSIITLIQGCSYIKDIAEKKQQESLIEWQQPEVFRLIANRGRDGISFADLSTSYRISGLTEPGLKLKPEDLQEAGLRRVLIRLISQTCVIPLGKDRFRIRSDSDLCGAQNTAQDLLNNLGSKALEIVDQWSGQATPEQVFLGFQQQLKISRGDAQLLFNGLVNFRSVGVHRQTNMVWNLVSHQEMMPMVQAPPVVFYSGGCVGCGARTTERVVPASGVTPVPGPVVVPPEERFTPTPSPTYDGPPPRKKTTLPPSEGYPTVPPQQ
jgi:hypothetical protein